MQFTLTPVKKKPLSEKEKSPYLKYYYCVGCGWIPKESVNEHLHCPHCGLRVRTKPLNPKRNAGGVRHLETEET